MATQGWRDDERNQWDDDRRRYGERSYGAGGAREEESYRRNEQRPESQWQRRAGTYGYGRPERYRYDEGYGSSAPRGYPERGYPERSGAVGGRVSGAAGYGYGDPYYGQYAWESRRDYGPPAQDRDYDIYGSSRGGERGWWDRTKDELRSWGGNDEAESRRRMDRMEPARGGYYGRGPRGYSRSDERIREDVCDRLCDDAFVDASDMEVNVSKGEVTLTGSIESRAAKCRAEGIAENVSGVRDVQNNLRIKQSTEGTQSTQSGTEVNTGIAGRGTH